MVNMVLFGAPGAGKGTLAGRINTIEPIAHISTGDLLRENVKNGTPIGKKAKSFMDAGKLVPDKIVIDMVNNRLKEDDVQQNGFMLDGFPRTLDQAKALDKITQLNVVVVLDIEKEALKQRILGRVSCPQCGKIYNIYNEKLMPQTEGLCDDCQVELTHRDDDNEETFEKRWNTYQEQSVDVIQYYDQNEGLVKHIESESVLGLSEDELRALITSA